MFEYSLNLGPGVESGVVADMEAVRGRVLIPDQTHSCNVAVIGRDGAVPPLDNTDALICMSVGVAVGVRTADCVPVVMYASDIRAVAAVHAGWKGTLGGIVTATVEKLKSFGANPAMMRAAFGPSICGHCYEVSAAMTDEFTAAGFGDGVCGHRHIDLEKVNCMRLLAAGVPEANIEAGRHCTLETPQLPSWRRTPGPRRLSTWIELIK